MLLLLLLLSLCVFGTSSGQSEEDLAPPHFVHLDIGPKQVFYSGNAGEVNCEASGNPKPTVKLSRMRTTLNLTPTEIGVFHGVTEGTYQCLAENEHGKARSDYIFVRHFGYTDRVPNPECSGDYAVLNCMPRISLKGTAPTYSWTLLSSKVIVDERHYVDVEGNLHLQMCPSTDVPRRATYTCKANFIEHHLPSYTHNVTLTNVPRFEIINLCIEHGVFLQTNPAFPTAVPNRVDGQQNGEPRGSNMGHQATFNQPTTQRADCSPIVPMEMIPVSCEKRAHLWTYQQNPQYGDPLILECMCLGPPGTMDPNVTWEIPARSKSKMNTTADIYNRRLVIGQVDHHDSGLYSCICYTWNRVPVTCRQTITVQAKYIWQRKPVPQIVKVGDTAKFICDAKWSNNTALANRITWYINDEPIHTEDCACKVIKRNELLFFNVTGPEANKNIQCNISSGESSLYYNSYLQVNKRGELPPPMQPGTTSKEVVIVGCIMATLLLIICGVIVAKGRKLIKKKWRKRKAEQSMKFRLELAKYNRSSRYVKFPTHSDEFPIDRLHFLDTLGAGNFGKVMKAEALDIAGTGKWDLVAVKMCRDRATDAEKEHLYNETIIMRKMPRHINVVSYLSYVASSEPALLIMEYVPGGDLLQFLRNRRPQRGNGDTADSTGGRSSGGGEERSGEDTAQGPEEKTNEQEALEEMNILSSRDLSSFALQIAKGMAHVASYNVIHRDLAARNVLLGLGNVCKIADFGLSRDMEHSEEYEVSSMGPLPIRWMAPESLTDRLYTLKSDVWSFGIVLWELVTLGASPYSGQCARQVMASVKQGRRLEKPDFCSDHVYKLMTQCWRPHPGDRPTFSDLVDAIEGHLEEEAEYVQLSNFDVNIYNVIDMGDMDVAEEKV